MAELRHVYIYRKARCVALYVKFCEACRQIATDRSPPPGEYGIVRTQPTAYHTIAIDFITDLPEEAAKGSPWQLDEHEVMNSLATVTCKFSKKVLYISGNREYTAANWAKVLLRGLMLCDWGLPKEIISDRDPKFISALWKEIFRLLGVKLHMTTAYHPQADGQAERTNQTVEVAIRYHTYSNPDVPWIDILTALQHQMNNSLAVTIGRSPNELTLGFKPRSITDLVTGNESAVTSIALDVLRDNYQEEARVLIDVAGFLAKLRYDDRHTLTEFKAGDTVYLRIGKGYHLPGKPKAKWAPKRAGPFLIKRKVNNLAYELDFPPGYKVHPVVSVAHLFKPEQGKDPYDREKVRPDPVQLDGEPEFEVERIVDRRVRKTRGRPKVEYLTKWVGYESAENTWESRQNLLVNCRAMVEDFDAKTGTL